MRSLVQRSGAGHVGLHYAVTDHEVSIILTTARGQQGYHSTIAREELGRLVLELRTALAKPEHTPLPAAQRLYAVLLGPVVADLDAVERSARAAGLKKSDVAASVRRVRAASRSRD